MIKWVFLDVGNVIFNDDPGMAMVYRKLYAAIREHGDCPSFERLLEEREELILGQNDGHPPWTLARRYLGEDGALRLREECLREWADNYSAYNLPLDGIPGVVRSMARDYSLGIAANQPGACRDALQELGILRCFDLIGVSDEMDLRKPSPEFFTTLVARAGCPPVECVMVGDRIDNDVAPARSVGMRTVWVRLDLRQKGYAPTERLARLYFESQLRASVSLAEPHTEDEAPDATVRSVRAIPRAIAALDRKDGSAPR
ncbi:MAG: HAD family hydrolase [Candidatus Brocadiaceae bacterium]|jgi:HAD superfamily hydrolase (TIGR01549 family)